MYITIVANGFMPNFGKLNTSNHLGLVFLDEIKF